MSKVVIYTTQYCPYCIRAKQLLKKKGMKYTEIAVDKFPAKRAEMIKLAGQHTVPQIWIGDIHVGGFDDIWAMEARGELDSLLQSVA